MLRRQMASRQRIIHIVHNEIAKVRVGQFSELLCAVDIEFLGFADRSKGDCRRMSADQPGAGAREKTH